MSRWNVPSIYGLQEEVSMQRCERNVTIWNRALQYWLYAIHMRNDMRRHHPRWGRRRLDSHNPCLRIFTYVNYHSLVVEPHRWDRLQEVFCHRPSTREAKLCCLVEEQERWDHKRNSLKRWKIADRKSRAPDRFQFEEVRRAHRKADRRSSHRRIFWTTG